MLERKNGPLPDGNGTAGGNTEQVDSTSARPDVQSQMLGLCEDHRRQLHASGLSDQTIESAGIYTAEGGAIRDILKWQPRSFGWGRGMVFPFCFPDEPEPTYQRVKLDFPRESDDGVIKYESPRGAPNRAYFPSGVIDEFPAAKVIAITEGEKKALCVAQYGVPCIGLVGVWGWQEKRKRSDTGKTFGQRKLIRDLRQLDWQGKHVALIFDSDIADNEQVALAESRFAEVLTEAGATVRVVRVPSIGEGKTGIDDYLVAQREHAREKLQELVQAAGSPEMPDALGPGDWAKLFIDQHFHHPHGRTLQWWRDEFYRWTGKVYVKVPESELTAIVFHWLDERRKGARPRDASEVVKALASVGRVPFEIESPVFLGGERGEAKNIIAFANGLLDITNTGGNLELHEHSPSWFSMTALPYDFDPGADCPRWLSFLDEVLGDTDLIELLQRWCGLLLTCDTSYQKVLLLFGVRRGGKGTILRVIQHLVGKDACVSPTFASLASEFGLSQLVGKSVALFPDAHLSRRADSVRVLETIKSISGEDAVSINRKNLPYLTNVRLRVRFIITVNELPRFHDPSLAIESRLLVIPFEKSFAGCEDRMLEGTLKAEAGGILNWCLRGLHKLRSAGRFDTPAKSAAVLENYRRMVSPVSGFIDDRCVVGPGREIECGSLYRAWGEWCQQNGHEPGSAVLFGSHLAAAEPTVQRVRKRDGVDRTYRYVGIDFRRI